MELDQLLGSPVALRIFDSHLYHPVFVERVQFVRKAKELAAANLIVSAGFWVGQEEEELSA